MSANVCKELSKFPRVVAASYLAEPLFFLSLEEEGGHLGFAHFGISGGSSHTSIIQPDNRTQAAGAG